jgi:transcriptional regulator
MDFLQGTLDMLVLRTLAAGPMHGYGIAQAIRQTTEDAIAPEAGSLYPSLQRLELKGLLSAKWESSKGKRRVRVYRLTPTGRKRLNEEVSQWEEFVRSVGRVLYPRPSEEM